MEEEDPHGIKRAKDLQHMMPGDQGLAGRRHPYLTWDEASQLFNTWNGLTGIECGGVLKVIQHDISLFTSQNSRHITDSACFLNYKDTVAVVNNGRKEKGLNHCNPPTVELKAGLHLLVWGEGVDIDMTTNSDGRDSISEEVDYMLSPKDGDAWKVHSLNTEGNSPHAAHTSGRFTNCMSNWPPWLVSRVCKVTCHQNPESLLMAARYAHMTSHANKGMWVPQADVQLPGDYNIPSLTSVTELWRETLVMPLWDRKKTWKKKPHGTLNDTSSSSDSD